MTPFCRIWTGAMNNSGYGKRTYRGVQTYAHRVAYVEAYGPIPEGMEIDHLCRNRACYEPSHLEAVTHAENMRRGRFATQTHCIYGHPYDASNTRLRRDRGGRICRMCNARHQREYQARKKEEASWTPTQPR